MPDNILPDFNKLWNYNDPAATAQKFRDILPAAEAGDDRNYHIELLTQIARAYGLQRQFDQAHQLLDQVEAELTLTTPARPRVRYLLERGRVFNSNREQDKARPFFKAAYEIGTTAGEDFYAVDAAHMMGIAAETPELQLEWNLKALSSAEKSASTDARGWLGSLYNNIGWVYHGLADYEQALNLFTKALAWRQSVNQVQEARIAKWCIARCLRSLERVEEALALQIALLTEGGDTDGYGYEEIGECLLLLNRAAEAGPYFAKAYEFLTQDIWLTSNEPKRLARLKNLAAIADGSRDGS